MGKNLSGITLEKQKVDLINRTDGFGVKKTNETIGVNHSCSRLTNKNSTLNQFVTFLNSEGFEQKLNLVMPSLISDFIQEKVEDGNANSTIKEHLSKISSSFTALNNMGFTINSDELDFADLRVEFKNAGYDTFHTDRSFENSQLVVDKLYTKRIASGIISELQNSCGYRISEAFQVRPDLIEHQGNELYVREAAIEGKGGFPLHKKKISPELYRKIQILHEMHQGWGMSPETYNLDIKYVHGNKYSSHCFRYNYAQSLFQKLIDSGNSEYDALLIVSEAMGHHRASITKHYLKQGILNS